MYKINFTEYAKKQLSKIDRSKRVKIYDKLNDTLENPYNYFKPLKYNLFTYWKLRVADYRIIAQIQNQELIIEVVDVGHRREIYKKYS